MSSPECGVLSSRGWSGGLSLPIAASASTSAVNDAMSSSTTLVLSTTSSTPTSSSGNTARTSSPNIGHALSTSASTPAVPSFSKRGRASPSPMNRVPLLRQSEERKAKRCRFYRNGDRWFPGALLAVSSDRHRTWDALLEDLTRLLEHPLHLAAGVRFIFSLDGDKVEMLDQLLDSGEYVASSTDSFKTIDYRAAQLPQWRLHTRRREALHVPAKSSQSTPQIVEEIIIRPRLVTVFRNGQKPRKAVRVLLNRKTARSLDQVMADLSTSLKLDSGAVRKIYSLDGRQLVGLKDLFQDDEIFIACGQERFCKDDLYLDNEETRSIQALLKNTSLSGNRRRMPSPKPRGRPLSPLPNLDHTGSLPRGTKISRESPTSRLPPHLSFQSSEDLFLPAAVTSRYRVGRILGDGNFAVVRECKEISTKRMFALKIIDKSKCQGKEDMIQSEVDILKKINHENIVRLEDDLHYPDYLYLVMELVTGGDLFDAIAAATRYTEREAGHLIRDLVSALQYLHERNIVHRDVKPENLLVVPGPVQRLKLGDFGLAVELTEPLYTICGTPTYVAPEILSELGYGLEVDIWAAGVIAYILLCGFPPFISQTNNQEELFEQILAGVLIFPSPYWDHVGMEPRELIAAMVVVEPSDRYTAHHVLQHPWITGQCTSDAGESDFVEFDEDNHSGDISEIITRVPPPVAASSSEEALGEDTAYDFQHNEIQQTMESQNGHSNNSNNSVSSSSGIDSYSSSNDNSKLSSHGTVENNSTAEQNELHVKDNGNRRTRSPVKKHHDSKISASRKSPSKRLSLADGRKSSSDRKSCDTSAKVSSKTINGVGKRTSLPRP